jgi:hypothetical protein
MLNQVPITLWLIFGFSALVCYVAFKIGNGA